MHLIWSSWQIHSCMKLAKVKAIMEKDMKIMEKSVDTSWEQCACSMKQWFLVCDDKLLEFQNEIVLKHSDWSEFEFEACDWLDLKRNFKFLFNSDQSHAWSSKIWSIRCLRTISFSDSRRSFIKHRLLCAFLHSKRTASGEKHYNA